MVNSQRAMLYTIAMVLLILWLLGFVSGYTFGAFIHVLLVIALVLLIVQFLSGRRDSRGKNAISVARLI